MYCRAASVTFLLVLTIGTSAASESCHLGSLLLQTHGQVQAVQLPAEEDSSDGDAGQDESKFLKWMQEQEEDAKENAEIESLDRGSQEASDEESENISALVQEGVEWQWWQKTPGCHCDVTGRRRNEVCRMVRSDEHYYFIQCNTENRRRASVQGCHCEHESTLGDGWYCGEQWWNQGGRGKCRCRSDFIQEGAQCTRKCKFLLGKVIGFWKHFIEVIGTHSQTLKFGTESSRTDTTSESWSLTLTEGFEQSASVGFEVEGISASQSFTVSQSTGETWGYESSTSISTAMSTSSSRTWSSDGLEQGTHVWQWMLDSYNQCNELVGTTSTEKLTQTPSRMRVPCCMPDKFAPGGGCEVGGSMFSTEDRPLHCMGDGPQCFDLHPQCGHWVRYCTTGSWVHWMQQNCPKTCIFC